MPCDHPDPVRALEDALIELSELFPHGVWRATRTYVGGQLTEAIVSYESPITVPQQSERGAT